MPDQPTKRQATRPHWAEEQRRAHIETYSENAQQWWDSGRKFYIVRFNLGGTTAGLMKQTDVEADDVPGLLQAIEEVGWALYNVGYVYQPLKERSHGLTDSALMSGNIIGIYTFKRPPPRPDMPAG